MVGRLAHGLQALSAVAVQTVLYCPIGHASLLHGEQVWPLRKYPASHAQSHASVLEGLPAEV